MAIATDINTINWLAKEIIESKSILVDPCYFLRWMHRDAFSKTEFLSLWREASNETRLATMLEF